jgi:anti-sigma regulatory factor (Ser/Thr protein kinase)
MNPGECLRTSYPALPESVPRARGAVAEFATAAGMPEERLHAVRLAVSEAITNVVTHAYNDIDGAIELCVAVAGAELWVLVSDNGGGLKVGGERRGLGLGFALIALSADNFTIAQRSEGGIELRLGFNLDDAGAQAGGGYARGSVASAIAPASARFSTTR